MHWNGFRLCFFCFYKPFFTLTLFQYVDPKNRGNNDLPYASIQSNLTQSELRSRFRLFLLNHNLSQFGKVDSRLTQWVESDLYDLIEDWVGSKNATYDSRPRSIRLKIESIRKIRLKSHALSRLRFFRFGYSSSRFGKVDSWLTPSVESDIFDSHTP